jgi:ParB family chromosome partitioning protein
MTTGNDEDNDDVVMVPVKDITVLNPRSRNRKLFLEMKDSIAKVGLKKPITVTRHRESDGNVHYKLVCGQSRLEAFIALGQKEIPAIVIEADTSECFVKSLVENLARRHPSQIELLQAIGELKGRGYDAAAIAAKVGLGPDWIQNICVLLENGEKRLIYAVESGRMPLKIAIDIVRSGEAAVQATLTEAFEKGGLTGAQVNAMRRIIDARRDCGKDFAGSKRKTRDRSLTADALLNTFNKEAARQRLMVKKAELVQTRLVFIVTALRRLMAEPHFQTLLRAENLTTMPLYLSQRLAPPVGSR